MPETPSRWGKLAAVCTVDHKIDACFEVRFLKIVWTSIHFLLLHNILSKKISM